VGSQTHETYSDLEIHVSSSRGKFILVVFFLCELTYQERVPKFNFLQLQSKEQKEHIIQEQIGIFYNVYFKENDTVRGINIVKEQLQVRASSDILANTTLYYNHFGDTNVIFPPCEPCVRLNVSHSGNEVMTLEALQNFCYTNPSSRVIYIHSKGTYTSTRKNDKLRKILTKGAFSDLCTNMPRKKRDVQTTCNVCMAKFNAVPFHASPGNMFVAECIYVNQLVPPRQFARAREEMMKDLHSQSSPQLRSLGFSSKPSISWQFHRPSWIGIGRYAMEHWICSHPSFQGCDVFNNSFSYMNPPDTNDLEEGWALAPRDKIRDIKMPLHPFFLLKGMMYAYKKLYNETPPNSSWIFDFYT